MSSAIPKALFSIRLSAPAADALLHNPSDNVLGLSPKLEYLGNQVS